MPDAAFHDDFGSSNLLTDPAPLHVRHGAHVVHDGSVSTTFVLWAPAATTVHLQLSAPIGPDGPIGADSSQRTLELSPPAGVPGWWWVTVPGVGHAWRYRYSLDHGAWLPDPASGWQPDGVHGASAVVDPAGFGSGHTWTDHDWRGVRLADTVLYELHVGTFTPAGTFDAAINELGRLRDLGITTIEVMPVNAFPGERNWGYDGVFPYAVQQSYGGPDAFARFVDAAHAHGLAVVLDVVYNHLGPEGNVLGRFAPYFDDSYDTPWGPAVNMSGPGSDGVRRYVLENVRRWVRDFHLDGFRLDAVHAVVDPTANSIWEQVADVAHQEGAAARRTVTVIAETSDNDPRYVRGADRGGYGLDAQWNDDVHHTLRVALTGDRSSYYADYTGTAAELADTLRHRWHFRGQYSTFRDRHHGRPVDDVAPHRFVTYWIDHDQIGNRPAGDRPDIDPAMRRLAPSTILLLPSTPMLFMGEEYDDPAPFPFFVDHQDPGILEATRTGRRQEFAGADWSVEVPDPGDPATMRAAVLDPSLAETGSGRALLGMYTELLRIRRDLDVVRSTTARQRVDLHDTVVGVHRSLVGRDGVSVTSASSLLVNLGDTPATLAVASEHADRTPEVAFDSSDQRWDGPGGGAELTPDGDVTVAGWTVALLRS
jgi:maltooligosyltrehalose trehalohydrolase